MDADVRRTFLKCKECGYMLTTLSQINKEIEFCPVCGDITLDYAPQKDALQYANDLKSELDFVLDLERDLQRTNNRR